MFTITVYTGSGERRLSYTQPVSAVQVLSDAGVDMSYPCGGDGRCQKCKILLNGSPALACRTQLAEDAGIVSLSAGAAVQGVTQGRMHATVRQPLLSRGYGAAIDIGTTTVAGYIYRFPEGELVRARCLPNRQVAFGADVISRIDHAARGDGEALRQAVVEVLRELTEGYEIDACVIVGNTTMLYLLTGENPAELAVAPYRAERLFGEWHGQTYLARCISAYVGADVTAAFLSADEEGSGNVLLVDIGTNGEMMLRRGDRLLACSTAAGPCFEGAGIACGVAAVTGAIHRVRAEQGRLMYETIDGAPPVGLCGTGLVDAVAALLQLGVIDESGYMEENVYFGSERVYLSPDDVRSYQLAKSAIRSGIETLLHVAGLCYGEIDKVFLSGGFGSYLNVDSAVRTGLLPRELADRTVAIGNGAGMGASMMLMSREALERAEHLAAQTETVELACDPYFVKSYMDNMGF